MTQEQFEALGIEKNLAKKAAEASKEELKTYVPKDTYDTVNHQKEQQHKQELDDLKMTNAIKMALSTSAQDSDLVAGLVDRKKLILGEDGKVTGLDEQVKQLKENKPFLFKQGQDGNSKGGKKGFFPLGPKEQNNGSGDGERHMTMKEAIAAKLNLGTEGKGE